MKITILGDARSKKNSKQIIKKGGKPSLISSNAILGGKGMQYCN
jgi:hypothetical protein